MTDIPEEIMRVAKLAIADWLNEQEGFSWRLERCPEGVVPWLETAWAFGVMAERERGKSQRTKATELGGLTARQRDLLLFVQKYIGQHGFAPSFEEMKAAMGVTSKQGIHRLLTCLEERGYIKRISARARAITLVTA